MQGRFKINGRQKMVTGIKQSNLKDNIKSGIVKHYPYFLSIRLQEGRSLL